MRHTLELIRTETLLSTAWSRGIAILAILAAFFAGLLIGRTSAPGGVHTSPEMIADRSTFVRPGPWGLVEYVPISIECPEELLPVQGFESQTTHWVLPGYTVDKLLAQLSEWGITGELREEFRSPEVLTIATDGLDLTPTPRIVQELPREARASLYRLLASFPENFSALTFVLARSLDERFASSKVSPETVAAFHNVSCNYGRYLIISDLASFLPVIPTYEERIRFLKAITRQSSLLAKLRVTPESDVESLVRYWGKASAAKDIRALLESVARVPGGARLSLLNLLPPTPSAMINTFPTAANPLEGSGVKQDCHWTAFNFFGNPPDNRFANPEFIQSKLRDDYFPVATDPRYGDLVLLFTPRGDLIHSAVFIADNIVYTKNGGTQMHPWMFSTMEDVVDKYSFQVAPDQALTVKYFRNKSY